MRLPSLRKSRTSGLPGLTGAARLDRRTKNLAARVRPGDIAIINHVDIDRSAAAALVEARVAAVVNLAPSISGRYPNLGPEYLLEHGVVLIDNADPECFTAVNEGDEIRIDGDTVYRGKERIGAGTLQTPESVASSLEASKDGMATQLEAFSANAMEHLRREQDLLLDGVGVPEIRTKIDGRQVLVVVKAFEYQSDLKALRTYIRENAPLLIGVDAGADVLLEAGYRPDLIVGDVDEVSDAALRCGAEVVAHAGREGRVRGADRLERLGISHLPFVSGGTSEDCAILLAHTRGAALIVVVGSHSSLVEFLDKGRSGMASSFLTRAAVGSTLVNAAAVSRLYKHRLSGWLVLLILLLALAVVAAALLTTPVGQDWFDQVQVWADDFATWVKGRLS